VIWLDDENHERLWRICDAVVQAGARAALICDESNGAILVAVGDASAQGVAPQLEPLGAGRFAAAGSAGEIYGVNVPGGALLVVLHEPGAREAVRAAAASAADAAAGLIANLPPPPPPPAWPPDVHEHVHDTNDGNEHTHEHRRGDREAKRGAKREKAVANKGATKKSAAKSATRKKAVANKAATKKSAAKSATRKTGKRTGRARKTRR
jgi:hypothetical protein